MEPHGTPYRSPPRSPQWLEFEYQPVQLEVPKASPTLNKRQSLRLRPEELMLENGEPPSPLNLSFQSAPSPTLTPRMSLLNLFSAPKVERQRSYAEPGVDFAPQPPAIRDPTSSKPNLAIQVESETAADRPASVFSGKTAATKWTKWKPKSRPRTAQPKERKPASFEAPPLFQAYPQSTKNGILEIASISVDALNKEKLKSIGLNKLSLEKAAGDRSSVETKRTSALKYLANGSAAAVELPKKIFVLVTSGYLLQYAERGLSDRLPEKVLHLGKDSAAFACDLVPGKHYVLQVSQAVDQDGIIIANSGSFLSRLGIRTAAAKRMTSNLVLVLPNAEEMESWMTALREEIEALGGKKIRHHTARPKTTDANAGAIDLKKTPSQSHRYQVKRNPSKVSSVTSPKPYQTTFPPVLPDIDIERSDRSTIDDIEFDAALLHRYLDQANEDISAVVGFSELSAVATPPAVVVEQAKFEIFDSPPEAPSESVHISPAKTAVTVPTWKERKSSLGHISLTAINFNPTTPKPINENDIPQSPDEPSKPTKPASALRDSIRKAPPPPLALHSQTPALKRPLVDESPIIPNYPSLSQRTSTRLTNAYTERNFPDGVRPAERHDSKVSNAVSSPTVQDVDDEVPESHEPVVVQRPKRNSSLQNLQNFHSPNGSVSYRHSVINGEPAPIRKVASFSMPLKVNPTATNGPTATGNVRRHSRMDEIGYALTPSDDSSVVELGSDSQSLAPSTSNGLHKHSPSNSPPGRLSLFPSPRSSQVMNPNDNLKRLPSNAMRQSLQSAATNGGGAALKRPNSLQVRSDHAPFLAGSTRNSTGTSTTTVPIRAMKPSRSASNVASLAKQQSSIEEFKALNFNTSTVDEEVDLAMPLPADHTSSAFNKPASRGSVRKSLKAQSSLPNLDFGLPVVGLGPPAPPPKAPLPAPPPVGSRTTSPTPIHIQNGGIDSVAGLGISV